MSYFRSALIGDVDGVNRLSYQVLVLAKHVLNFLFIEFLS